MRSNTQECSPDFIVIISYDFTEMLIVQLTSSVESIGNLSEDAQIMWFDIESALEAKIKDGLVLESTMISGGKDSHAWLYLRINRGVQVTYVYNLPDEQVPKILTGVYCWDVRYK